MRNWQNEFQHYSSSYGKRDYLNCDICRTSGDVGSDRVSSSTNDPKSETAFRRRRVRTSIMRRPS